MNTPDIYYTIKRDIKGQRRVYLIVADYSGACCGESRGEYTTIGSWTLTDFLTLEVIPSNNIILAKAFLKMIEKGYGRHYIA